MTSNSLEMFLNSDEKMFPLEKGKIMSLNGNKLAIPEWEVIATRNTIQDNVEKIADNLDKHYASVQPIYALCILKGGFRFYSDLLKEMKSVVEVGFAFASSYGHEENPGRINVNISKIGDITNKHVLVIDDICDTGRTLAAVVHVLEGENPASIKTCTFLLKKSTEIFTPDFHCMKVDNDVFCAGYGMDYKGYARNFPFIVAKPKE